jgi:hypothetical protein
MIVALLAISAALSAPDAEVLIFEGLRSVYQDVSSVRIVLRNTGVNTIHLNSFRPHHIAVERWNGKSRKWELGDGWECANVGMGTPQSIEPHATWDMLLSEEWSFALSAEGKAFHTRDGDRRPLQGRYRVSVRYSFEPWSDIGHVPKLIQEVTSSTFEIR